MLNLKRTRATLVSTILITLLACPALGIADNPIFQTGDNFTSHVYFWDDPVFPDTLHPSVRLRSATAVDAEAVTYLVDGDITDATTKTLLAGARVFCYNNLSVLVSTFVTDGNGSYQLKLPKGSYTVSVSKLTYVAVSKQITVTGEPLLSLNFDLAPVQTNAGYLQVLNGSLAEGTQSDITLENSKIAMSIAVGSSDPQLGAATKGKPIDLSTTGQLDGFDWINLPLISKQKLSGITGSTLSQSRNVVFSTVNILSSTPTMSKVLASGTCTDLPLNVKNLYVVKPDKDWFDVTTTIQNVGDSTVSFWLGDAMDNDEDGQTSLYPMQRFGSTVIVSNDAGLDEYKPADPWMGCFGNSDQVFGIFYKGDFAKDFIISANTYRTVSQKFVSIQPGATYVFSRQIAAVTVRRDQTHAVALRSCYETNYDEWGLATTMRLDKTHVNPGDTIECILTITNVSKYNVFEKVSGVLSLPPNWKANVDTIRFGDLNPLRSVEAKWKLVPAEGSGNTILSSQALAWDEPFTYTERAVFVSGEGWYAGDNHVHSKMSDGWATIQEDITAAKTMGLSFMSITDHNTTLQDSTDKANTNSDFLVMTGCEVTPNYKVANNWGHAVSLFSNKMVPLSNTQSQANAQTIVNDINALIGGHGYAIMAHPYLKSCPWIYTDVTGFKGVEVWSCFTPIHGLYANQAFALWDKKNNAGLKQFGFAESDSHNLDMVGRPHIVAHLKDLTEDEVESAMRKGQFFGTNGPSLRFTVDTVMMGGCLPVNSKRSVKITMKAYSINGIDSMYLIKNGVLIRGFSYAEYRASVQQTIVDEAIPGDFYRMECTDCWSQFAFSNPVFIVPAQQVTPQTVDSVSTGLRVEKTTISMYPNPGLDFVRLKTVQPTKATISVYDMSSKLWLKSAFENESEKTLDVRSLPRGLYIVKINENRLKLILR